MYLILGAGQPLSKIDVDVLIQWCRARNDPNVWPAIATGVTLWVKDDEKSVTTIQEAALALLEASPEPMVVLEAFAERISPSSWTGSLSNIMQLRADAFSMLSKHERPDIAKAARIVHEKIIHWIERQIEREQREDSEREQRFE
ncbi:hypothetical protein ACWM6M_20735 [Klebsiella quasivariicola]